MAQSLTLHRVVTGLADPTDIQSPRDGSGRLFIVEQAGRIRIVKNGTLLPTPFLDIRGKLTSGGERGLLGLAFPPQFTTRNYFYISYTDLRGEPTISRYRIDVQNLVKSTDETTGRNLFSVNAKLIRVLLYRDDVLGGNLRALSEDFLGSVERFCRYGVAQQRFFTVQAQATWSFLCTTTLWVDTEVNFT